MPIDIQKLKDLANKIPKGQLGFDQEGIFINHYDKYSSCLNVADISNLAVSELITELVNNLPEIISALEVNK